MEPLRKTASRPISARSVSEDSHISQQSGRTPSALDAEQASASLRSKGVDNPLKSASSPDLTQEHFSLLDAQGDDASIASAQPPLLQLRPSASHAPLVPSPLNPSSPFEIGDTRSVDEDQRRISDGSKSSSVQSQRLSRAFSPPPRRRPPPPRPPLRGPLQPRHSSSTLTMRDLGSDYTRYYNPFSDSARSSFCEYPKPPNVKVESKPTTPLLTPKLVNPFSTPNVSTTKVNEDYGAEKTIFLVNDRLGAPYDEKGKGALRWPLITDGPEDDDEMHLPQPDDDIRYKPNLRDHFSRGNLASTVGLILMIIGLLSVFIALPVLSAVGIIDYGSMFETPLDQMPKYYPDPEPWAYVNNKTYPLLEHVRRSLIDPDTPDHARKKKGEFGEDFELVFSDEFNTPNRTFYEGDDPFWYAPDLWYGATQDLEWYDPDAVTTFDGTLELRLDKFINHGLQFRSGMLNSWNHVCFKGGIFEVSMSLPGPAAVMGLWPGAWTMGNLGRPGYLSTTDGLWPYTYQACDVGITPNQSSYDGLSRLPGQRLPSCTCPSEDHPTPGKGRGAPEIDIVEGGASYGGLPIATQSYQVAPFDIWYYPDYNFTAFPDYSISYTNGYTGGPYQQAISATTNLNGDWYDGKAYQKYSFEYAPGEGKNSYIVWKVGGQTTFMMDGRAIGANGNVQARQISEEPMSLILNLGISNSWTWIDWARLVFPTVMRVDYVRWYQKKGQHIVTCDPEGFETTEYIKDHMVAYTNPNLTKWDQTGFNWPRHKLNSDCKD